MKTLTEWEVWCRSGKQPPTIPRCPDKFYKHEGWHRYGHWLGTRTVASEDQQFGRGRVSV